MKILNLIKCEFIKNFTFKKLLMTLIILLISVIGVTEFQEMYYEQSRIIDNELSSYREKYESIKKNPYEDTLKQEYEMHSLKSNIANLEKIQALDNYQNLTYSSWQLSLARQIIDMDKQEFIIDKYLNGEEVLFYILEYDTVYSYAVEIAKLDEEGLKARKAEIIDKRTKCLKLIDENKFYKYVEFQLELGELESDDTYNGVMNSDYDINYQTARVNSKEIFKEVVTKKIESDNDYRVKNIYQLTNLGKSGFESERVQKLINKTFDEYASVLEYAIKYDMKQDLTYGYGISNRSENIYFTTKSAVNQILTLGLVVMILIILTSGDIISKEHTLGTEKMLLTFPNKRWKILLSKFIYMILNMYIIWFIALILLSIYAGIKYGFNDLFTSKLIVQSGSVVEVNYLLYIIKQIFYVSIPVITLISIIFMISIITLNTTITVGSTMVITVISPFLWHFIQQFKLSFVAYTPLPYLMFSNVINLNENYLKTMEFTNISETYGIIISIITILVCYFISHRIYTRRDVKNQ